MQSPDFILQGLPERRELLDLLMVIGPIERSRWAWSFRALPGLLQDGL